MKEKTEMKGSLVEASERILPKPNQLDPVSRAS